MRNICGVYMSGDFVACQNYGGWVVVDGYDYNIYKRFQDAYNSYKKRKDNTNGIDPIIIGRMTNEQFINALKYKED